MQSCQQSLFHIRGHIPCGKMRTKCDKLPVPVRRTARGPGRAGSAPGGEEAFRLPGRVWLSTYPAIQVGPTNLSERLQFRSRNVLMSDKNFRESLACGKLVRPYE